MSTSTRRIPLDRRVCVVREGRIDVRPERGALVGPLLALLFSLSLFVAVAVFSRQLPALALAAMLVPGLLLGPFSAMALVYSLFGANVVIDAKKRSASFQQGVLGLGLGTVELVPFWKIDRLEVRDLWPHDAESKGPPPPVELRAWDVVLVKASGKELSIGQVMTPDSADLIDEAFDRALDVAEAVAQLVDKPLAITAAVEEPAKVTGEASAARQVERFAGEAADGSALSEVEGSRRA